MLIYKILTHSRQSCKSVYFVLYFNVCTLKILPWINSIYLLASFSLVCRLLTSGVHMVFTKLNVVKIKLYVVKIKIKNNKKKIEVSFAQFF